SLWFTVFGDSGILRQQETGAMLDGGAVNADASMFMLLEGLPRATITSVLAILVVAFFFINSSDSGSMVIDMLSTGGEMNTSRIPRVYWSTLEGITAAVLLLAGGQQALTALQTMAITTAIPFSI